MEEGQEPQVVPPVAVTATTTTTTELADDYTIKEGDSVIFCINEEKYTFAEIKTGAWVFLTPLLMQS